MEGDLFGSTIVRICVTQSSVTTALAHTSGVFGVLVGAASARIRRVGSRRAPKIFFFFFGGVFRWEGVGESKFGVKLTRHIETKSLILSVVLNLFYILDKTHSEQASFLKAKAMFGAYQSCHKFVPRQFFYFFYIYIYIHLCIMERFFFWSKAGPRQTS